MTRTTRRRWLGGLALAAGTALFAGGPSAQEAAPADDAARAMRVAAEDEASAPAATGDVGEAAGETAEADGPRTDVALVTYVPPAPRGMPDGRWGAGTRGDVPRFEAIAPEAHPGHTALAQPTLHWYLGEASDREVTLSVYDMRTDEAILQISINAPVSAGIHSVTLGDHGIRLESGVRYQWVVSMPEAKRRSNVTAGGYIERVVVPAGVDPSGAETAAQVRALAEAGLWYDAFAAASRAEVPALRAALLDQVGLGDLAL